MRSRVCALPPPARQFKWAAFFRSNGIQLPGPRSDAAKRRESYDAAGAHGRPPRSPAWALFASDARACPHVHTRTHQTQHTHVHTDAKRVAPFWPSLPRINAVAAALQLIRDHPDKVAAANLPGADPKGAKHHGHGDDDGGKHSKHGDGDGGGDGHKDGHHHL
jgi:hypothetical protein